MADTDRDIDTQLDALFDGQKPVPSELRELVGLDPGAILWRESDGPAPAPPVAPDTAAVADLGEPLDDVAARCGDLAVDAKPAAESVPARPRQLPSWLPGLVVGVLVGVAVMAAFFPRGDGPGETASDRRSAVTIPHSWEQAPAPASAPPAAGMRRAQVAAPESASAAGREDGGMARERVAYQAPFAVLRILPEYAPADLAAGEIEKVVLRVLVDEEGHAARVLLESGTPGSPRVAAAVDAVVQSHYRPASENGLHVAAWMTETFLFEP